MKFSVPVLHCLPPFLTSEVTMAFITWLRELIFGHPLPGISPCARIMLPLDVEMTKDEEREYWRRVFGLAP